MPFVADVLARGEATGECEVPAWDESRDGLCVIEVRTKELKESSGRVLGTVVVLRDVTAERSAQRTLQANLSLLSTLLDAIHLGVAVEDHRGALAMSNLALREIFQGAASARIGLADELPGLDQDTPSAGDWAQLANLDDDAKQLSSIEVPLPNGRVLECDVVPFPAEDGKRGRIWLWRDVTDRRQEEETQRRQREMEAVGRLAGGIAHNFNDLLTVINGYSQVVSEALDASDPLQRSLTRIRQAGDRAASLTRQLLVFSGRLAAHARALHLNAVIDDVRPVLERSLGASARLCLDLAEDLPMIWSNVAHLEEMLVNLVDNARDSIRREGLTEGEGTVRIATREKRLDGEGSDGWAGAVAGTYVELSVCDNGRPMADEELAELFVPFRSGVGSGGGPGLGLAIVYGLVEQAGGRIRVESGLGAGTEFRILLPCRDVAVGHTSALSEIAQESLVVTPDSVP